ncbi:MAG: sodium-dependent transporter [Spiroplasma sp.]|nr:sodium-dependent transporter [Spiroplasma sp.]
MAVKKRKTIGKFGFLLSVIGSTVGLGGIWGFPTQMYLHRGAFFIPFIICMVICAIPVLFLEMTIGNKSRQNHIEFFTENAGKKGAIFGWLQSSIVLILSSYYSVLIGWTLINIIIGFTSSLNQPNFFYDNILNITNDDPTSFGALGNLNWKVLVATLVVWVILIIILIGGVDKGINKVNQVFIPSLFVMIIFLVIYTSTLTGAGNGLNVMLEFNGKELLSPTLWKDAFGQAFFMLSTGTGTIYIYSAHAPKNQDNTNHAFVVGLGTSLVGFFTAMIVFSAIGNIAAQTPNKSFDEVFGSGGPALIFQVFPQLFAIINQSLYGFGNVVAVIFFLTLAFAGISSLIGQVESMVNALEYDVKMPRIAALLFSAFFAMIISILFTFDNSPALINAVGTWIAQIWLLIFGLILLIGLGPWGWKLFPSLKKYNDQYSWIKWTKVYTVFILALAPIIILINIGAGIYDVGLGIQKNAFTNALVALIVGIAIPVILALIFTYQKEIRLWFHKKKKVG